MNTESIGDKRRRFTRCIAELICWGIEKGYGFTFNEALRSNEQAEINAMGPDGRKALCSFLEESFPVLARFITDNTGSGIRNSLHEVGLAIDANLFKSDGKGGWIYIDRSDAPEWIEVGSKWESMGSDHAWGGRFGDGNHFSIAYMGRK